MIKILLGGSPCTHWSIAQKNGRETQPNSGLGWELFLNYKIALEKYKPDYFLYENNKSASQAIKDEIGRQLGFPLTYINSALVSAQNRQRFYVMNCGEIKQPEDRGILIKDILEKGCDLTTNDKSYALTTRCSGAIPEDTITRRRHTMVAEPVNVTNDGKAHTIKAQYYKNSDENFVTNGGFSASAVAEPVSINSTAEGDKARTLMAGYYKYGTATLLTNPGFAGGTTAVAEPVGYAIPCEWYENGRPTKATSCADGKIYTVYEVKDGKITIKGKQYPIKLSDGFYIIRKLTVKECKRLQTIPDWYEFPVSDTQAYKMLGNGWTVEVIKHLLSHIPNIQNEEIEVLSMYDGMSCGQIALREMGCNVAKYYATEIDKYAIQTTQHNFPNTIQLGDAFQVREEGWGI